MKSKPVKVCKRKPSLPILEINTNVGPFANASNINNKNLSLLAYSDSSQSIHYNDAGHIESDTHSAADNSSLSSTNSVFAFLNLSQSNDNIRNIAEGLVINTSDDDSDSVNNSTSLPIINFSPDTPQEIIDDRIEHVTTINGNTS